MLKFSLLVGIFTGLFQHFPKNRAIFVQIMGKEKIVKICFRLFDDKEKILLPLSSGGGGGGERSFLPGP